MKVKCDYCDALVDEELGKCPHCGAILAGINRTADEQPKTIEELQAWYTAHNLPPEEVTRFFIGKDIKEPKAFGIYKDSIDDYVVYKNKADGTRAIRYQGKDQAYAVGELYQRLKAEIVDQKARNRAAGKSPAADAEAIKKKNKKNQRRGCGCLTLIILVIIGAAIFGDNGVPNGYYKYQGTEYYHQNASWYKYDNVNDTWLESASLSDQITEDNYTTYSSTVDDHKGTKFEETSWYDAGGHSDDGDWDNDNDWSSSDDWDNSSTDWDSDW